MTGDRGQAYTLEGVIGAILIASAVILGLQAVDIAPWTQGTNDQKVDSLRTQAEDLLSAAEKEGTLEDAVTCFGPDGNPAAAIGERSPDASATALGPMLNRTFYENGFRYNVYLKYYTTTDSEQYLVFPNRQVPPGSGAVTVTRQVTVLNGTGVSTGGACGATDTTAADAADDLDVPIETGSQVAYVAEVRIVVW